MGNQCTLSNDTKYPIQIKDYDSNRMLYPGDSRGNWLAKGADYYIDLQIQFPDGRTVTRPLRGCDFNNDTKYMSSFFRDVIQEQERREREQEERKRMDAAARDMLKRANGK